MAKANLWQWSSTPSSNTDINSIDITGTTGLVKNGDNALREIMGAVASVEAKGSDVASASTLALGSQRYYHVTGTTTITDLDFTDAVDGRWAWLVFDGALTLTHNGTTLKLPGNANIVTEAGDRALFVQDASDNVICLVYERAAAIPITTGTWTPTDASGAGLSFSSAQCDYTKVGRLVTATIRFTYPATANGTVALVGGLPFTAQNNGNKVSGIMNVSAGLFAVVVLANTTTFNFGSSSTQPTNANLSGASITGTITYFATS